MNINFLDVKNKEYYIVTAENAKKKTLSELLDTLAEQENLKRDGMRLFFKGKFLDEKSTFESLKINEDSVLQLYSPHSNYEEPKCKFNPPDSSLGYT